MVTIILIVIFSHSKLIVVIHLSNLHKGRYHDCSQSDFLKTDNENYQNSVFLHVFSCILK